MNANNSYNVCGGVTGSVAVYEEAVRDDSADLRTDRVAAKRIRALQDYKKAECK
jgi:hypothetical protein